MKTKQRVYVKATSKRKSHYRMQDVGREEIESVENLWEITTDKFDRLVSGSEYPDELADIERSARMRKKIFDRLPEHLKYGFCAETMNLTLHRDVVNFAAKYNMDVPKDVKEEYPTIFSDVPFNYQATGESDFDLEVNKTLENIRSKLLSSDDEINISDIREEVYKEIGASGESVPIDVGIEDHDAKSLVNRAIEDVSDMISPNLLGQIKDSGKNVRILYNGESGRSNFTSENMTLNLLGDVIDTRAGFCSSDTICHEYGHAIEEMSVSAKYMANRFLDQRTIGEEMVKLGDICPGQNYRDNEIARIDHFISPYIGKRYSSRATEVLSMGMGYLTTLSGVKKLYEEDPEYLGFIVTVLKGKAIPKSVSKNETPQIEINLAKLS